MSYSTWSISRIKQAYRKLARELHRQPRRKDSAALTQQACRVLGSWTNLVLLMGDTPLKPSNKKVITRDMILERIRSRFAELGRVPLVKDDHCLDSWIRNTNFFQSRTEAIQAAGLPMYRDDHPYTEAELLEWFHRLQTTLGRVPEISDDPILARKVRKLWGSWGNFVLKAGELPSKVYEADPQVVCDILVRKLILEVKRLGRLPKTTECRQLVHQATQCSLLGSYSALCRAAGFIPRPGRTVHPEWVLTEEALVERFLGLEAYLGRQPKARDDRELLSMVLASGLFQSWSDFVAKLGRLPRRISMVTPEVKNQLLQTMALVYALTQQFPTLGSRGWNPSMIPPGVCMPSHRKYVTVFGSLETARKAALDFLAQEETP